MGAAVALVIVSAAPPAAGLLAGDGANSGARDAPSTAPPILAAVYWYGLCAVLIFLRAVAAALGVFPWAEFADGHR